MNPRNPIPENPRGATPESKPNIELAQIERRMRAQEAATWSKDPEPEPMHDRDVPAYMRRRMPCCDDMLAFTERGQAERMKTYTQSLLTALDTDTADREAA